MLYNAFIQYASGSIYIGPIEPVYTILLITEYTLALWNNVRQLLRQEDYVSASVFLYVCLSAQ